MAGLEEARLREAMDYMKEADKNTETGWFKKPDWDIAAQYYEKAAQSFKFAKSYDRAVQAFAKASDAMVSASSLFMAGRALENGANVLLQNMGQPERAADMYKRASELYMRNMAPDRAAEMLEKSAKAMEPISVDSAIDLYIGACNIYENEDRARYATDTFKRTVSLLVKHKRFDKAIEVLQRLGNIQRIMANKSAYFKTLLSIVIIQLAAGDEVDASKRFQAFCSIDGFVQSEESAVAHGMLDAFERRDQEYFNQTAARQHVGFLDNEIARLARSIVISNDLVGGSGPMGHGAPGGEQWNDSKKYPPRHEQFNAPQPPVNQTYQAAPPLQPTVPLGQKNVYHGDPYGSSSANQHEGPHDQGSIDNVPPPYPHDERQQDDWRALTEKPSSTAPHQQRPLPGASPGRNYTPEDDDDEGLL
ncbi:hypothetical protein CPB97_001052 [Podila verticillata]|nr:hypothetical protein CPB97_001052 [Podila verticillata]